MLLPWRYCDAVSNKGERERERESASNVNNARSDKCNRVGGCGVRLYLSSHMFVFHRTFLIKNSFCRGARSTHQDKATAATFNKRAFASRQIKVTIGELESDGMIMTSGVCWREEMCIKSECFDSFNFHILLSGA